MSFKIETGLPIPAKKKGQGPIPVYPFAEMKTGDSFFVPSPDGEEPKRTAKRISGAAYCWGHNRATKEVRGTFTIRAGDGGARCWRIT